MPEKVGENTAVNHRYIDLKHWPHKALIVSLLYKNSVFVQANEK
jgi:hypothetical protein